MTQQKEKSTAINWKDRNQVGKRKIMRKNGGRVKV